MVDAEHPSGEWSAVDPQSQAPPPEQVVFIDGVRRVDARVWITVGSKTHSGLCASVAAGAVRCANGDARVVGPRVFRGVYADATLAGGPIITRYGAYDFVPCASSAPEDLYRAIHERMMLLETQIEGTNADLVVFDGPLRGRTYQQGVGFIKTQHVQYLPDREQQVLTTLRAGQRTPLFLIGGPRFTRWSWYLRLPGPIAHPMAGIARCEVPGQGGVSDAARRADTVTANPAPLRERASQRLPGTAEPVSDSWVGRRSATPTRRPRPHGTRTSARSTMIGPAGMRVPTRPPNSRTLKITLND